jgi:hypothetical protein
MVVKEIGIVVVQSGFGDDVVILTDPLPPADVGELKAPFRVMVADTPGEVAVVVRWNEFPTMGCAGLSESVVNPSVTPHAGPANPTPRRVNELLDTIHVSEQRCAAPLVGVQACEVVPLQLPSNCPAVTPACVIVTVSPATDTVPLRGAPEALAATEKFTMPLPEPDAPLVMTTKAELLTAVQVHPGSVETLMVPDPPAEPNDAGLGAPTV